MLEGGHTPLSESDRPEPTVHKPEYPPLLPGGLHYMAVPDLRALCVGGFPLSQSREPIMIGVEKLFGMLVGGGIEGELWVDGSFLTEKVNPADVDVVLFADHALYDHGTANQQGMIDDMDMRRLDPEMRCDNYVSLDYPIGHACYPLGVSLRNYWKQQFGTDAAGDVEKGIAVVRIP